MPSVVHELHVGKRQSHDDEKRQSPSDWPADGTRDRNCDYHPGTHSHHEDGHAHHPARDVVRISGVFRFLPLCHFYYHLS